MNLQVDIHIGGGAVMLYINLTHGKIQLLQYLWTVLAVSCFYIPVPFVLEWKFGQISHSFWKIAATLLIILVIAITGITLLEQCFLAAMD